MITPCISASSTFLGLKIFRKTVLNNFGIPPKSQLILYINILSINYANEKLHKDFNDQLFHIEQEDYVANGIPWNNITYIDNSGTHVSTLNNTFSIHLTCY